MKIVELAETLFVNYQTIFMSHPDIGLKALEFLEKVIKSEIWEVSSVGVQICASIYKLLQDW